MVHFLKAFFDSLAADGIRPTINDYTRINLALQGSNNWTITRFRDMLLSLLARDVHQQEVFRRQFDMFFKEGSVAEDSLEAINADINSAINSILEELKTEKPDPEPVPPDKARKPFKKARLFLAIPAAILIALTALWLFKAGPFSINESGTGTETGTGTGTGTETGTGTGTETGTGTGTETETVKKPPVSQKRTYTNVPYIKDIEIKTLVTDRRWKYYSGAALSLLSILLLYLLYLRHTHKIPDAKEPFWEKDKPRRFSSASIGGQPAPLLDHETLNNIAESMGHFHTSISGKELDVPATIKATCRNNGFPSLLFAKQKKIRSLLILEDTFAEARTWNPIARELAGSIPGLGIPVLHGFYNGSPEQFTTQDGSLHRLEDFEDSRQGFLVLIFTDGKGLYRHNISFIMEQLVHWPMVAWMELREPRSWDAFSLPPVTYDIPIYPATPTGLMMAVKRFLAESGSEPDYAEYAKNGSRLPMEAGMEFSVYLERLLGDALSWAQECALLQPVSPGLADALRNRFHPRLPQSRIERLFMLPNTHHTAAGLSFSSEVLQALRKSFHMRRDDAEQEAVLNFILAEVEKVKPSEENSLKLLGWESIKERIKMELDPFYDLVRLSQLAKTPLGASIDVKLEDFGFPGDEDKIPLRFKLRDKMAIQRLARISDSFDIPILKSFPISRKHLAGMGLLLAAFLGFAGLGGWNFWNKPAPRSNWEVSGAENTPARLDVFDGSGEAKIEEEKDWVYVDSGTVGSLSEKSLVPGKNYRLRLYGSGTSSNKLIKTEENTLHPFNLPEGGSVEEHYEDCLEKLTSPGLGLVQRCPDNMKDTKVPIVSWKERLGKKAPGNRELSVGLEIVPRLDTIDWRKGSPLLRRFRNTLLKTGSVDILYRVGPGDSGKLDTAALLEKIRLDLGPLVKKSQLVWWSQGTVPGGIDMSALLSAFDRSLELGKDKKLTWVKKLEPLFKPEKTMVITESEIKKKLAKATSAGAGKPVVLVRPSINTGWLRVFVTDEESGKPMAAIIYLVNPDVDIGAWRFIRKKGKKIKVSADKKGNRIQLNSGKYKILATSNDSRWGSGGDLISIEKGKETKISFEFPNTPKTSITVFAKDINTGMPIKKVELLLKGTNVDFLEPITTDNNGKGEVANVLPGKYIIFSDSVLYKTLYDATPGIDAQLIANGAFITIAEGEMKTMTLELLKNGTGNLRIFVRDRKTKKSITARVNFIEKIPNDAIINQITQFTIRKPKTGKLVSLDEKEYVVVIDAENYNTLEKTLIIRPAQGPIQEEVFYLDRKETTD